MSPIVRRLGLLLVLTGALTASTGIAQEPQPTVTVQPPRVPVEMSTRGAADRGDVGDFYYFDGAPVRLHRSFTETVVRFRAARAADISAFLNTMSPQATVGQGVISSGREYRVVKVPVGQSAPGGPSWAERLRADDAVEFAAPVLIYPESGRSLLPTEEILVKLGPGTTIASLTELATAQNLTVVRGLPYTTDEFALVMASPKSGDPLAISRALHESGLLAWAEPNFIQSMQPMATPNDPRFGQQWHLSNSGAFGGTAGADVKAPAAWGIETGKASTVIAVIDDSVERTHEDLAPNLFVNPGEIPGNGIDDDGNLLVDDVSGWDFASNDNDPSPFFSNDNHGTAVAGVAAGRGNNGIGITGACQSCRILPVRVAFGVGLPNSAFGNAIRYAATLADILNSSWGGGAPSSEIQSAIAFANTNGRAGKGSVVLFASGNSASGFGSITSLNMPAGTHRFRWTYSKDSTVSSGNDTVWLAWALFPGSLLETFQGGSLPAGWTTGGNGNWSVVTDPIHTDEGMCLTRAAKAGTILDSQSTFIQAVKTLPAGNFRSYQWVSSEGGFDGLVLEIDLGNNGTTDLATSLISGVPVVNPGVSYPAAHPESIAVGATSDRDCRARYSQVGPQLAFVTPSNSGPLNAAIETTDRMGAVGYDTGNYTQALGTSGFGGTSSATPLAAGVTGLIISRNPTLTRAQVLQILQNTADKVGPESYVAGRNDRYGSGRLNAHAALVATPPGGPTANHDSYNTPFNTVLNVPAPGVLGNDNSNGGGTMTAVSPTAASSGTLTAFNTDGSFTYTPAAGFSGTATFTYRASNINGPSNNVATVTVNVATGPSQPGFSLQPVDSTVFVGQSAQFSVAVTGSPTPTCQWQSSANLGASWTNLSNSPPYSGVTTTQLAVSNATLAMSATQFRCFASNTQGTSASNGATLSVAVVGSGGTPSSGGWTGSTSQSLSYGFTVNGGTNITPVAFSVSVPGCGFTVSMTLGRTIPIVNNAFSYTDTPGSCTTVDSMTGTFASPTNASGILRLTHTQAVGCNCVGTTQVSWNATSPAALPQFLLHPANQTRATGQTAQFTVAASGSPAPTFQWEMSTNGGGSWGPVPAISPYSGGATPTLTILGTGLAGLNGAQFRARAQNASGPATSNAATLIVNTGPVPTTVADSYPTPFNTPLNIPAPGVLANDNTNGGGPITASEVAGPLKGVLTLATNGGFTYTPNAGSQGVDSFTYRASNAAGPGNVATVSVTIVGGPNTGPEPPTNFRVVSMAGNTVTFAWTPPTSGAPPTGYQIEGGLVPAQVLGSLPLGNTPVTTLTLPSGALFLRMRTLGGGTASAVASNELLTYVNVPVPPSAPANLLGLVVGNTLNLAWTPTFGGGVPTTVILDVSGAVNGSAPLGPTDTFSFAGVPAGTYTLSVRAVNASGSSASSTPVTLTFPTACSGASQPVANFLAYKTGGTLFLNWDPPASGTAPTSYLLNVTGSFVGSIPTALRALSGAVPAGTYNFSVVARNACGDSAATAVQTVTIP